MQHLLFHAYLGAIVSILQADCGGKLILLLESAKVGGRKTPTALDDCSLEGMASNWSA